MEAYYDKWTEVIIGLWASGFFVMLAMSWHTRVYKRRVDE